MKKKPLGQFATGLCVLTVAGCALTGCTFEQILIGQSYTIYTPPAGPCPSLEWQFVVSPQRTITGVVSGDGQMRMATLSGSLDADDSFQIAAADGAGNPTAQVTGQFTSQVSTISIHGGFTGSTCDGQTFKLRLGRYFAFRGGGGGGGG